MKLWLLRHGEAEPQARQDAERRLTARGRAQVLEVASWLVGQKLDAILASPYLRAQETAELVREALGDSRPLLKASWLTPDESPRDALRFLDAYAEQQVLLVSHQPLIGSLGALLVQGSRSHPLPFGTASLAELTGQYPAAGLMQLASLRHPSG